MVIRCIDNDFCKGDLTLDNFYTIMEESVDFYYVINDRKERTYYNKRRFIKNKIYELW